MWDLILNIAGAILRCITIYHLKTQYTSISNIILFVQSVSHIILYFNTSLIGPYMALIEFFVFSLLKCLNYMLMRVCVVTWRHTIR